MLRSLARRALPLVLLLAVLPPVSQGQGLPPLPTQGAAPLLYVRFLGPPGMHVTFFQGRSPGRDYPAPVVVGLRPGYPHRVRLTGLPDLPGVALAPTLEVRGTLCLPPHLRAAAYPAPVTLTEEDVTQVLGGSFVTKVVYLEDPERAATVRVRAEQPLEVDLPPTHDLLTEARDHGRLMLIVRLGQRDVGLEELVHQTIPGTVFLPDEKFLAPAPVPPYLPWACVPLYDPFLGPKPPTEECLHDGGDGGRPAGLDSQGRLHGLDPADTVAEYADSHGQRHLACSNRVCLYVPRFAILRTVLPLAGYDVSVGPAGAQAIHGRAEFAARVPSREAYQNEELAALQGRQRPTAAVATQAPGRLVRVLVLGAFDIEIGPAALLGTEGLVELTLVERTRLTRQIEFARQLSSRLGPTAVKQFEGTSVVGRVEGLGLVRGAAEVRDLTICCHEAPHPPDQPLCLFKWANAQAAQVGDTVTFYLKYSNHGGQPISDVAVSDSLTGRLEYVPGSARSSRNAVFTMQENEAGSLILRWEISGRLLPGENGIVSFQARIR